VDLHTYNLKLPGQETRVLIEASVGYDARRGGRYVDRQLRLDGVPVDLHDLTGSMQRWLRRDLLQAEMVRRDFGGIDCPHGRYLVRDCCADCLAAARPTV
jgi:hypothetical protein